MKNWLIIFAFVPIFIFAQDLQLDEVLWNLNRKLKIEDYKVLVHNQETGIRSSINLSWQLAGFNVFNKNFNQNVQNKFSGNSSVINPSASDIEALLEYQQIHFDLSEIYARIMRRELLLNKNKLWKGFEAANQILNKISYDLTRVQVIMDKETQNGENLSQLEIWQQKIKIKLEELAAYDYQNTSKIKVKEESKEIILIDNQLF